MPIEDSDLDAELDAISGAKKPLPVAKPPPPGSNASKYILTKPAVLTPAMQEKYTSLVSNFRKMCDLMLTRAEEAKKGNDGPVCTSYANIARELAEQVSVLEFMKVSGYDLPPYKSVERTVLKSYNIPALNIDEILISIDNISQSQNFQVVPGAKIKFCLAPSEDFSLVKKAVGSWRKEGGFSSSVQMTIKFDRTDYRKMGRSFIPVDIGIKMTRSTKSIGVVLVPLAEFLTRSSVVYRSLNVLKERKPITTISMTVGMQRPLDPKYPVDRREEVIKVPNIGLNKVAGCETNKNSLIQNAKNNGEKGSIDNTSKQNANPLLERPEGYSDDELLFSTKFIKECYSPALLDQGKKQFRRMREQAGHDLNITKRLTELEELCKTTRKDILVSVQSMKISPAAVIAKINFAMEYSRRRLEDFEKKKISPPAGLKNRVEIMRKDIVHFKRTYKVSDEELRKGLMEYVQEFKKMQALAKEQENANQDQLSNNNNRENINKQPSPGNSQSNSPAIKPLFPYPQPDTLMGIEALKYTIDDLQKTKSMLPVGSAAETSCSNLLGSAINAKNNLEKLLEFTDPSFTKEVYVFALARCAKREEAAIKIAKSIRCNDVSVIRCEKRQSLFLKEFKEGMSKFGISKLTPQVIPSQFKIEDYTPNPDTYEHFKSQIKSTPRTGPFIPFPEISTIWSSDCLNEMLKYGIKSEEIQQRIDSFEALVEDPEFDVVVYCAMMYKCMMREKIAIKAAEDLGIDDESVKMARERFAIMQKEFDATLEEMEITKAQVTEKMKTCPPMPPYKLNE